MCEGIAASVNVDTLTIITEVDFDTQQPNIACEKVEIGLSSTTTTTTTPFTASYQLQAWSR